MYMAMKGEENLQDIKKIIDDPKYTSFVAQYLRQHKDEVEKLAEMRTKFGATWKDMIRTALLVPQSKVGFYAADADSYNVFHDVLKYVVRCHNNRDADPNAIPQRQVGGEELKLQVSEECKKRILSARCRFARNLENFPFPTFISNAQRQEVESQLVEALNKLSGDLAGVYTKMGDIDEATRKKMVENHQLFHNEDEFLEKGNFYRDWPNGRGQFHSHDGKVMLWIGEEDHIRCMSLQEGSDISACYNKATQMLEHLDKHVGLAHHSDFGWLTSCPTNVGTGMRASVHISLPRLKAHKSIDEIKAFCKSHDLDIRGIHGENTGFEGDVFDVSNRRRYDVATKDAITDVIKGLDLLVEWELSLPPPLSPEEENRQLIQKMIDDPKYTSFAANYLREHKDKIDELVKMKTKFGNTWKDVIKTGLRVPESKVGFYAADADCYDVFADPLKYVIRCHNMRDPDPSSIPQRVVGGDQLSLQVSDACKERIISARCRFARNLANYVFPTSISSKDRKAAEAELVSALGKLSGDLAGTYTKMGDLTQEEQDKMVENHQLFHNKDEFLAKGDFYDDWPNGRGQFHNHDGTVMVWVGEEDHIRCMSLEKGSDISSCYNKATRMLEHLDKHVGLAHHPDFGWLTSCPTNVGTGMRASVHISLPRIKAHMSIPELKEVCKKMNLDVRGTGGENTGFPGVVFDISNRRRFDVSCQDAITDVIKGLDKLMEIELSLPEPDPSQEDREVIETLINDPKYTSFAANYLREHKDEIDKLIKMKTKFGNTWKDVVKTGLRVPGSKVGFYAADADCYDVFGDPLKYVIRCHNMRDPDPSSIPQRVVGGDQLSLQVSDACKERIISARCRFARNLTNYVFPTSISPKDRIAAEAELVSALGKLSGDLAGTYTKMGDLSQEEQDKMVENHQLFHNKDEFLAKGDFYDDWPNGRGQFHNQDGTVMVWVGEEDHIRCMSLEKGSDISSCYNKATRMLEHLDKHVGLAHHPDFGWLTSCPTNVGTGMRASVHISLPRIKANMTISELKEICKKNNLDIRGTGGENTGFAGVVFDVSNRRRFDVACQDAITDVIKGLDMLMDLELSFPDPEQHNLELLKQMIEDSKYTSFVANYLREHKDEVESLAKMQTKFEARWKDMIITGLEIPDSKVGIYASDADSYVTFSDVFKYVVRCHNMRDPDLNAIPKRIVGGDLLDLQVSDACKERIVSARCRFARNLSNFAFPTFISNEDRLEVEKQLMSALSKLTGDLAGKYTKMEDIPPEKQEEMVKNHQLFHNKDHFLEKGRFFRDWPKGRGVFMSNDGTVMVWVGEEDHIRCMSLEKGSDISSCYNKATRMLEHLDKYIGLAHHSDFGWLTSCPTNVGTGMRASVHISLPRLKAHKSIDEIKAFCKSHDLDFRGIGGENTGFEGDVFDVSNRRRYDVACKDAITDVINGLNLLMEWEQSLPEP